jgi:AcrR family transcriptional regulator
LIQDDRTVKTNSSRRGRPPVTSRAEILDSARRLIDEDGWEKLTVRRLARDLGIGTATIYHHVRDCDDLLIQLINDAASRYPKPELPADPLERVIVTALAMHEALGVMPWAAKVLAVDGEGCLGRPGEDALWFVDVILSSASDAGCTHQQSGELFLKLWYFIVGELLVQTGNARHGANDAIASLGQSHADATTHVFSQGVRALVNGTLDQAS